jgi:hypothetical protein
MEHPVLHSRLPSAPWMVPAQRRLPGVQPLDMADWLLVDEAYAGQMALRDRLIAESARGCWPGPKDPRPPRARRWRPCWRICPRGFTRGAGGSRGPMARWWTSIADTPLAVAGRWCRRTCASSKNPTAQTNTCSPPPSCAFRQAGRSAEKIGRPLGAIHGPVPDYDPTMAARVQRMFDAIRPGTPALAAERAALCLPRPLPAKIGGRAAGREGHLDTPYLRSERQCLLRLPKTGAIVFSIHTYVLPVTALSRRAARGPCRVSHRPRGPWRLGEGHERRRSPIRGLSLSRTRPGR